jgi:hypothetical protein
VPRTVPLLVLFGLAAEPNVRRQRTRVDQIELFSKLQRDDPSAAWHTELTDDWAERADEGSD